MYENRERRSFAPVRVGDEITVKIEAVGEKGDGVAKVKGFVLFVPGVQTGDEVKVRVTKVFKKLGFAEVVTGESGSSSSNDDSEDSSSEGSEENSDENYNSNEDTTEEEE